MLVKREAPQTLSRLASASTNPWVDRILARKPLNKTGLTRQLGRRTPRNQAPTDGAGISSAGCWYRRGMTNKRLCNFVKEGGAQHLPGVPWPAEDKSCRGQELAWKTLPRIFLCLDRVWGQRVFAAE